MHADIFGHVFRLKPPQFNKEKKIYSYVNKLKKLGVNIPDSVIQPAIMHEEVGREIVEVA